MQTTFLSYYQRVMLWSHLGGISVEKLSDASVYLRIIEKLRLSDSEVTETQFVADGPRFSWRLPDPAYGSRTVEFEDAEMAALAGAIGKIQGIRVSDAEWMMKLVGAADGVGHGVSDPASANR